jgi:hypothetical protein
MYGIKCCRLPVPEHVKLCRPEAGCKARASGERGFACFIAF